MLMARLLSECQTYIFHSMTTRQPVGQLEVNGQLRGLHTASATHLVEASMAIEDEGLGALHGGCDEVAANVDQGL